MSRPLMALALAAVTACAVVAGVQPAQAQTGVQFDGTNDYVTFGQATSTLGTATFTLECWFRRTGAGAITSTGTGGVTNAIPLLTKGRGEAEMTTADCNYFMGIRQSDSVLVADYEEGAGQASPGLNHPIAGRTPIRRNVWYHGAATFDGTTLRLFLNGRLEATVVVGPGHLPQLLSAQHAAIATGLTTAPAAGGFFAGTIDEARIWDHARPEAGIRDSASLELTTASGLLGRWGLNDGAGFTAVNSVGSSPNGTLTNGPTWVTGSPFRLADALQFNGSSDYATFGDPAALDLPAWTVECWFRRDGAGNAVSTGAVGGVTAVPMVTHGAPESDNSNLDMNWYLGLRGSDFVLAADFEEGALGTQPGLNHSITGTTTIPTGVWNHAAMTYDGNEWRLYLNGVLENSVVVGQPAQSNTIQPASLATAHRTTGAHQGFFNGALDEVRVWSSARSLAQIQAEINNRITAVTPGLVARWALDEAADSLVNGSAGTTVNGAVRGTNWAWVQGAPFNVVFPTPPAAPTGLFASAVNHQQVHLTWTDNAGNETAFDIERSISGPGGPFAPLATIGANVTSYDDFAVNVSAQYCYQVKSRNAIGSSLFDGPSCATTPAEPNLGIDFAGNTYVGFGDPAALDLPSFTIECWFKREGTGTTGTTGAGGVTTAIPLLTKGRNEIEDPDVDMNWWLGIRDSNDVLAADFEEGASGGTPGLNHPIFGTTTITNNVWHHAAATYDGGTWHLYLDGHLEATLSVGQPVASASTQQVAIASALRSDGSAAGFFDGVIDEARVWSVARSRSQIQSTINTPIITATAGLVARWSLNEAIGTSVAGSAGTTINGTISGASYSRVPGAPFDLDFVHTIIASAGPGGTITPDGAVPVNDGADQAFTIVGIAGYSITGLDVDGSPATPAGLHTFTNVLADHTITATFADVTAPLVQVTTPNGGESLIIGTVADLQWTASDGAGVTNVDLLLSRAGEDGPWETIATDVANTGSYPWTVTGPDVEDEAMLRVVASDAAANNGIDESDEVFSIIDAPTATLLAMFEAEPVSDGVRVRWRMSDPHQFPVVTLERSDAPGAPFLGVLAELRTEGNATVALDRTARYGSTYQYRLTSTYRGAPIHFGPISATAGMPVRDFALTSIAPNPSPGMVRVNYALPKAAPVRISIHDVQGRELALLVEGDGSPGNHQATWSGGTDRGPAAAGVYYVRMVAAGKTFMKRLVLAR